MIALHELAAYEVWAENVGVTDGYDEEGFREAYAGHHDSEKEFAQELFSELYLHEVPEHIRSYIDYDAFRRDLFCGDYYSISSMHTGLPGMWIFRNI